MQLTDSIPDNGNFSLTVPAATLAFKPGALATPSTPPAEGEGQETPADVPAYEPPECYCILSLANSAKAFPVPTPPPAEDGGEESEPVSTSVTVTSTVAKGELLSGTSYSYSFSISVSSQDKLAVSSGFITSALINDGGTVEVFKKGAEGEEDEKLGGGSFVFQPESSTVEVVLGSVPPEEPAEEEGAPQEDTGEEKKSEETSEGADGSDVAKPDENLAPVDNSPGSLAAYGSTSTISVALAVSDTISDFVEGGASLSFGEVTIDGVSSETFGVTLAVEDDVTNDEYLAQLTEKLSSTNQASSITVSLSGPGLSMDVSGGVVSFVPVETDPEPETKPEPEPEELKEGEEPEEKPPPPISRPTVKYVLSFPSTSPASFLSYKEGKALKKAIRAGAEFTVSVKKAAAAAQAQAEEEPPAKKGKKGKKEEAEPSAEDAPPQEDYEESCKVSLVALIDAKSTRCTFQASLGEASLTGTVHLSGSPLFAGVSKAEAGGSEAISGLVGLPCVTYAKSLDRDMFEELRDQLDSSVDKLVEEYAQLFLLNESAFDGISKQEKLKRMLYHMNKNGGYFELKEALKPCLQRVVAEKLEGHGDLLFNGSGAPRLDTDLGNRYVTSLFHFLLVELNTSLVRKFVPQCVLECREGIENDINVAKNVPNKMVKLKMLAEDAEGNGLFDRAWSLHMDRINMAEVETKNAKDGFRYLIRAKVDFADFVLSSGRPKAEAIASLSDAVSLDPSNAENATLLSAILLEDGSGEPEVLLKSIFDLALPEDESGDGYDYEDFAKVKHAKILNILMALRHHAAGDAAQTRKALKTAALAAQLKGSVNPKRHVLVACLEAAEYLLANKLFKSAQTCLDWVSEFEAKAKEIAADCGASTAGAKELRAKLSLCTAKLCLLKGDIDGAEAAVLYAEKRYKDGEAEERGLVALAHAEVMSKKLDEPAALSKYLSALKLLPDPVPFSVYLSIFKLLSAANRWAEAREVMFRAAKSWSYSSVWLNISKASIKLGYLEDAEDSLQESNGADTNDPRSWGLFVIVCLKQGERLSEANEGLKQALGLGLSDLDILREMGDLFVAIDEMAQAEAVWRRGVEIMPPAEEGAEFGLRLAKCLEAQREFEKALACYDSLVSTHAAVGGHTVEQERAKLVQRMGWNF